MNVREELPQKDGEYLAFQRRSGFGIYGFKVGYGFGDERVTHWWELPPEPYRPEAT